jgi:hypothetical protein
MTSEIRVNSIKNRSGLSTVTWNDEGIEVVGIATALELDVSGNATIGGNLGVVGTLTYEDVTRVDALGLSTYREGLHVGPHASIGATVYKDGSIRTSGIITAASFSGALAASNLTGALPAIDGSNLTGIAADKIFEGNTEAEVVDTGSDGHFKVTTEGSERLRINSSGNVGIGTDNPQCLLDMSKDISSGVNYVDIRNHHASGGAALRVKTQGTYGSPTYQAILGASDAGGTIRVGAVSNHPLLLLTNNTERLRIQNSGNVGINDNDASYRLNVAGDNTASNGAGMLKGIIGVQNNTTAFGSSPTAGISFQTKYRSSPDVPLDVAAIYGGKENTSDADKDGYLGFAVREEGGSGTYEKMRLTSSGGLQLNGYNYIESCELRLNANNSIQSTSDAIKFATRFNTDSSLISINHSGGTGSGTRITFTKAVYVLVTVSQDVLGNSDTSYWSQKLVTNGGIQGYHLIRRTTQWDNMAWSEGVSIPANGWLEIQWNGTNGLTNVDADSWSHYHFLVWQNV